MIVVDSISKSFGATQVLNEVSLTVNRGEIVGIIGPGGGGKSVLLKILCGLLAPDSGSVHIDSQNIWTLDNIELSRLRNRIGVLFQNDALFDFMTVGENIAFPLEQDGSLEPTQIDTKVLEILTSVGLRHAKDQLPGELSGGMKKRVSLARAAISEAEILFYDDPSAGLDPVTSSKIFDLVEQLHHGHDTSTVVVSHDVDRMTKVCHRFLLVHQGRIYFQGTREQGLASEDPVVRTFFTGSGLGEQIQ